MDFRRANIDFRKADMDSSHNCLVDFIFAWVGSISHQTFSACSRPVRAKHVIYWILHRYCLHICPWNPYPAQAKNMGGFLQGRCNEGQYENCRVILYTYLTHHCYEQTAQMIQTAKYNTCLVFLLYHHNYYSTHISFCIIFHCQC
jgi:hypothetical protein